MKLRKFIKTNINFSNDIREICVYAIGLDGEKIRLGKYKNFDELQQDLDTSCKMIRWLVKNSCIEIWID